MKKRIAIAIDDFGEHATINAAALELYRAGRISAISCMTGGPAWRRGAAELRALDRQNVDLGLHLDLTQYPLRGSPWRLARLVGAAWLRRLDRHRLRDEVESQCDAFESALGRPPDHVDGHQHVHQLPQVRDVLVDTLGRRYDPRPWLRDTRRAGAAGMPANASQMMSELKAAAIERLGAGPLRKLAARGGFRQNRRLLGVHGLHADARGYHQLLRGWLRVAETGDLLITHAAAQRDGTDSMGSNRAAEYAVLGSPGLADLLASEQIEIVRMSELLAAASGEDVRTLDSCGTIA